MKKQLFKPTSVSGLVCFLTLLPTVTSLTANAQQLEITSNNVTTTDTYLDSDKQKTVEWGLKGDGNITNISQLEKAIERSVYQSDDTNSLVSESESATNIIRSSYDNTSLTTKNFPSSRAHFMSSNASTVVVLNKEVPFTPTTAFTNDNGNSNSDGTTNDAAPTISGLKTGDCHKFSRDGGSSWVSVGATAGNTEAFDGTLVVSSGTLDSSPTETATTISGNPSLQPYSEDVPDTFFFDITTPTGSTDKEVLLETGGNVIGITIFIDGTDLKISVGNDNSASDLTASNVFADGTRYAIIVELALGNTINFYVAEMSGSDLPMTFGAAVASQANAWSGSWCGPDGTGWGMVRSHAQGAVVNTYAEFSGTFHEGRFYSAKGFSEVWTDGTLEITNDQTINTNINEDIEISDTGSLTVEGGDINGDVTITNGGSLIVTDSGNVNGAVTYVRSISTTNWYLISSPVTGQDIDDFVVNSNLATGTGDNLGFSDYENATGIWTYYQSGTTGTGNFVSGKGHAVKLNATGSVRFTGGFNNENASIAVSSGAANNFNLIGNPYLANVSVSEMVTANAALLEEQTVWLWDEGENAYIQKNLSEDLEIAPGQGFFVLTSSAGNFSITEAMQSHQTGDTFKSSDNRPEINLVMTNGADVRDADIYYIDGTTTGFDNGYDSSIFGGVTNEFEIYTQAVANGTGKDLGIQSLPNNDFENMVIPVGINATSGTEIIISATSTNLPTGIHVYLEDKDDNSFTLLDDSSNFQTTFTNTSNGVGRFFIHTKSQPLSTDQAELNNVSIYLSDDNSLRIVGVQQGDTQVHIYSILGKQVVSTSFEGAGVNDILLPNLSMGIYMVQLKTKNGKLNKKIIIQQ